MPELHELRRGEPAEMQLDALIAALLDDRVEATRRIVERDQEELPSYGRLGARELEPSIVAMIEDVLPRLRDNPVPDPALPLDAYRNHGRLRAAQGISIEDFMGGWRVAIDEFRTRAEQLGAPASVRLQFIERLLAWLHVVMHGAAAGHREAELEQARFDEHHRSNLVRAVLFGSIAPADVVVQASTYGLDPEASYYAVRVRLDRGSGIVDVERLLGAAATGGRRTGLAAFIDGDVAGFVVSPPRDPGGAVVGVAGPATLHALAGPFRLATRALETALASGMDGVAHFDELGLLPAVLTECDVGDRLVRRYVDPVLQQREAGQTLLDTVGCYIRRDARVQATANELHLHINSVRYRLRRFEELTGADLRRVDDLLEISWALRRSSMGGARPRGDGPAR